jgi:hypothetical protein
MIKILHNVALFWVKNANFFAEFFGENILKIITSVPGHPARYILLFSLKSSNIWPTLEVENQKGREIGKASHDGKKSFTSCLAKYFSLQNVSILGANVINDHIFRYEILIR